MLGEKSTNKMSYARQRHRTDGEDSLGSFRSSRRVNGDYNSNVSASSMTEELAELVRIIELEWNTMTSVNVYFPL